jgi:hypothetical protein
VQDFDAVLQRHGCDPTHAPERLAFYERAAKGFAIVLPARRASRAGNISWLKKGVVLGCEYRQDARRPPLNRDSRDPWSGLHLKTAASVRAPGLRALRSKFSPEASAAGNSSLQRELMTPAGHAVKRRAK